MLPSLSSSPRRLRYYFLLAPPAGEGGLEGLRASTGWAVLGEAQAYQKSSRPIDGLETANRQTAHVASFSSPTNGLSAPPHPPAPLTLRARLPHSPPEPAANPHAPASSTRPETAADSSPVSQSPGRTSRERETYNVRNLLLTTLLAFSLAAPARAQVIGGRPPGCPHAFCGCGASLHLFGRIVPALNLAANWLRFPRAFPAPGMAAVRAHHVMVLEAEGHSPGTWLVHDSNSGGHLTRLHERSLAGYVRSSTREEAPGELCATATRSPRAKRNSAASK